MCNAMSRPNVSVIVPVKNRQALMPETVQSVLDQTFDNWECLVVDDGSTDNTFEAALALSEADSRVRVVKRSDYSETPGAPACRNVGIQISNGEYLVFLDSDDLLAPHSLATRVAWLNRHPEHDFIVNLARMFREQPHDMDTYWNTWTDEDDLNRFLKLDVPWQTASITWRRSFANRVGPWDEGLPSWQDWDQHIRALSLKPRFEKLVDADLFVRSHDNNIGKESLSSTHLRSHAKLVKKTFDLLDDAGQLDPLRNQIIAGLHFWLAHRIALNDSRMASIVFWCKAPACSIVGPCAFVIAVLSILRLRPVRLRHTLEGWLATKNQVVFAFAPKPVGRSRDPKAEAA